MRNTHKGEELQKRLSIKGNESFSSRAVRNYLEHFDRRLEKFQESTHHNIADVLIGYREDLIWGNRDYEIF